MSKQNGLIYINCFPSHSSDYKVFSSLNLLNMLGRVRQIGLNLVNIYYGSAPSYLCENFTLRSTVSSRNTRISSDEDFLYLM